MSRIRSSKVILVLAVAALVAQSALPASAQMFAAGGSFNIPGATVSNLNGASGAMGTVNLNLPTSGISSGAGPSGSVNITPAGVSNSINGSSSVMVSPVLSAPVQNMVAPVLPQASSPVLNFTNVAPLATFSSGTISPLDQERSFLFGTARQNIPGVPAPASAPKFSIGVLDSDLENRIQKSSALEPFCSGEQLTLYSSSKNSIVATDLGKIVVGPGSTFALRNENGSVRIINITGVNLTFVTPDGQSCTVNPGTEMLVSSKENPSPFTGELGIARRTSGQSAMIGGTHAYFARFSLASVLKHSDLSHLKARGADRKQQRLYNEMIKMAIVTIHLYGSGGFVNQPPAPLETSKSQDKPLTLSNSQPASESLPD